jgi:hypothetical protein
MNNFFKSLEEAVAIPSQGSVFIKNDNTLDKYIYEPSFRTSAKKTTSTPIFKHVLSPIEEEVDEVYETGGHHGGSRNPKINSDETLFIVVLFLHGGYGIDNTKEPVMSITKRNAPLIVPGNKFDGYESLTICGAAPPAQVNTSMPDSINNLYHPLIIGNLFKFPKLLSEKISSVHVPEPVPAPVPVPTSRSSIRSTSGSKSASSGHLKKGGGGGYRRKMSNVLYGPTPRPTPTPRTPSDFPLPSFASVVPSFSKFSKVTSSIKKVSRSIKSKLYSLVSGCVKILMGDVKVKYAFLDASHERYNILEKNIVDAIICMSRHGVLKINDDLFNAFSYSLFCGLREHDEQYFTEFCKYAISVALPGSESCITRRYALANAYERFPCIRSIVERGVYNANHVEKNYQYHPEKDADIRVGVKIYKYSLVSSINDKGEIYITPNVTFIDVDLEGEIFAGKSRNPEVGHFETTLSDLSLTISSIIYKRFFNGEKVKIRLSILDLSCGSFYKPQSGVPTWDDDIGMGGRIKIRRQNKTKRRSMRNKRSERKERSNSKIRNRRLSRQTRKNRRRS